MILIGITGTNGKTTSSFLLYKYFIYNKIPVTLIGSNGIFINDNYEENINTTPGIDIIYDVLKRSYEKNIKYIIMEVSSHAIKQYRIFGLSFKIKAITNITLDHMDFHKCFKDYEKTKLIFLKKGNVIINSDIIQAKKDLSQIKNAPNHNKFMLILMAGLSAFFFSFMFGGSVKESITAFFIGMILRVELIFLDRFNLNSFILSIINGALISILCALVIMLGFVPATITVMTAVLMQVVPGMAIVNAIRDLIAGDLIAGTARIMDAFMVASGLSVGSVCGVLLFSHVVA